LAYYCKECYKSIYTAYRKTDRYRKARNKYWDSVKDKEKKKRQLPENKRIRREYDLQRHYGISLDRHYQMWVNQKGRCDLCGKPIDYEKIHTDHNHITNNVRGLTCIQCNSLLGFAFVDEFGVEILNKAIKYVKHHE